LQEKYTLFLAKFAIAVARQKQGKIFLQKPQGKRNEVKCRPCRLLRAYFCLSLDNCLKLQLPFPCFKKEKKKKKEKKQFHFLQRSNGLNATGK
jgi:hypothetical protein